MKKLHLVILMANTNFNISALRALVNLEKTGSVSETALNLGVTQPAVSRIIARLETAVGLKLIKRGSRPIGLTTEGRLVSSYAHKIDDVMNGLEDSLKSIRNNKYGLVNIGSFGASASSDVLPKTLKVIEKTHPNIEVKISEALDAEIIIALREGIIDIAVIAETNDEFDILPVADDYLVALVPKEYEAKFPKILNPVDLIKQKFIMPLGGSEHSILQWFGDYKHDLKINHRILQTHSILAMVGAGLGCSIVSRQSLPINTNEVSFIALHGDVNRNIVFARKRGTPTSKAASVVWDQLEQYWM